MKLLLLLALLPLLSRWANPAGGPLQEPLDRRAPFAAETAEADALWAQGAFERARERYEAFAAELTDPSEERAWCELREIDSRWRSVGKAGTTDGEALNQARQDLVGWLEHRAKLAGRDRLWAEGMESLGDLDWDRERTWNFGSAMPNYEAALEYWGAAEDVERARRRFLDIVFRIAAPSWSPDPTALGRYNNWPELRRAQQAAEVAREPRDRALANYLLARTAIRNTQSPNGDQRIQRALEELAAFPRELGFRDHALWLEAEWLLDYGLWTRDENGHAVRRTEPARALASLQTLVEEFASGTSQFVDRAERKIEGILQPTLSVQVGSAFEPGSATRVQLSHRNVGFAEVALTAVDLVRDLRLDATSDHRHQWLEHVDLKRGERVVERRVELRDDGEYRDHARELDLAETLEGTLPTGAYVLEVRSGELVDRELVLVTDAVVQLEASAPELHLWCTTAVSGEPLVESSLAVWVRWHADRDIWESFTATTDANGLATLEIPERDDSFQVVACLRSGEHQAVALTGANFHQAARGWRIYAVTDRPAYRPDQEVHWRLTARTFDGITHSTPAGAKLTYQLTGPRGEDLETGELELNEFGSASGSFETTASMALGEYRVYFREPGSGNHVGNATLFRLEEYKLPEFEVSVELPEGEQGVPETFVLGDTVGAVIEARTYFGAPVAGGEVEVTVTRSPYSARPTPRGEHAWFRESIDDDHGRGWWGAPPEEQVLRADHVTDAEGRVEIEFDTPFVESTDWTYTIRARVVDAARREVTGTGKVNVRRTAYTVELLAERTLVTPDAPARIDVLARDANERPLAASGELRLYRARWKEVWADPIGQLRSAEDARALLPEGAVWPPPGWQPLPPERVLEEIGKLAVTTSSEGKASWSPELPETGAYLVRWISDDPRSGEVTAETWIYAAGPKTRHLELGGSGLQLVIDDTAFAEGTPGHALVVTDASDRWVWLRVLGERLLEHRVLHLEGNAQLVTFDVDATWVPNVTLIASEVRDRQIRSAAAAVVVPPVRRFLDLEVSLDESEYRPGSEALVSLRATDVDGRPVRTELSLSIFDASIGAIAQDLAGDPRRFFYGHRRYPRTSRTSSLQGYPIRRYELGSDSPGSDSSSMNTGSLDLDRDSRRDQEALRALGYSGGVMADSAMAEEGMPAPAAKSMAQAPGESGAGSENVVVRSDFRETAVWLPLLTTGTDGTASAPFTFPDSTTRWKLVARGQSAGDQFGEFVDEPARTSLPLVLRLARPRFLVVGDEATISVVLDNTTDAPLTAAVGFEVEGLELLDPSTTATLEVPAHASARRDFHVRADRAGVAELVGTAVAGDVADGVKLELPVHEHGLEVLVRDAGRLVNDRLVVPFDIPPAREGSIRFEITASPSLASTMLDALPYLTRFPHGCLEQTLSRFVPTVVAMGTLEQLGLDPAWVAAASFGGVEEAFVAKTQPAGREDYARFREAADEGLSKVLSWQRGDGSWSWFSGGDPDPWMTAYATWSLSLAHEGGLQVPKPSLGAALRWLDEHLVELRARPDLLAFALFAQVRAAAVAETDGLGEFGGEAYEFLLANRTGLSASGVALLVLTADALGRDAEARELVLLLENGVTRIENPDRSALGGPPSGARLPLAHWGTTERALRWSDAAIESTSFALSALLAVDPEHELVQPAMTWLVRNRRGTQWKSTRDTALAVLALCDYLEVSGEGREPVAFRVLVDGESVGSAEIAGSDLLVPTTFRVEAPTSGEHLVVLERTSGNAPLYWSISATAFSLEEPIPARASDLFVRRDLFRLVGYPTLLGGKRFERVPLAPGDRVDSGDRVEVVLSVQAPVALEYLLFEDHKPAGLEATELVSGEPFHASRLSADDLEKRFGDRRTPFEATPGDEAPWSGFGSRTLWVYRELRDDRVCLYLDRLPAGAFEMRYTLRAETPGDFHGLPATGAAMYVPEVRANSTEFPITVR